jgi:hypothetical protein
MVANWSLGREANRNTKGFVSYREVYIKYWLPILLVFIVALLVVGRVYGSNYTKAKSIVYAVFPKSTRAAALRVVGCETGYSYSTKSYNSSGASGYFQILTGNDGRVFKNPATGKAWRLDVWNGKLNRLFDPWYNVLAAWYMSNAGRDWHEWSCSWAAEK